MFKRKTLTPKGVLEVQMLLCPVIAAHYALKLFKKNSKGLIGVPKVLESVWRKVLGVPWSALQIFESCFRSKSNRGACLRRCSFKCLVWKKIIFWNFNRDDPNDATLQWTINLVWIFPVFFPHLHFMSSFPPLSECLTTHCHCYYSTSRLRTPCTSE